MTRAAETAERRRGRPRSPEVDRAILQAAGELLVEQGYQAMSMEGVRERAGVGKATLYRRYASKADLIADVVRQVHQGLDVPDTGNLRDDALAVSRQAIEVAETTGGVDLLPRLLVEAAGDVELRAIFQKYLVEPRRDVLRTILARAIERGEVRPDVEIERAVDLMAGPFLYRALITGGDTEELRRILVPAIDLVMRGIAAPGAI